MPQWTRVIEDGQPAVLFSVYEQPDGNAVQIAQGVQQKLAAFKLPAGVRLANWYDQSQLVLQSTASVRDAVLIGLVLAGLVLMVFLKSWRVTSIAILVVPATLMTTIVVLSAAAAVTRTLKLASAPPLSPAASCAWPRSSSTRGSPGFMSRA